MPLNYKVDVLQALKNRGFNTTRLRKEKILAEGTIQRLREKNSISWANIETLCKLLDCQPGDIIEYTEEI